MNIIAIDDDPQALELLSESIAEAAPAAFLRSFSSPSMALKYAGTQAVDAAFIHAEMTAANAVELAKKLKKAIPRINLIFVAESQAFCMDAFSLHASGYILAPCLTSDISNELSNLRYEVEQDEIVSKEGIFIRCFGNFEAYRNGTPIKFKYLKTKEFLAYLVDRKGALCTSREINAVLFEDDIKTAYYQKLRADLKKNLPDDILIYQRGCIGLRINKISCDYYDYLNGRLSAINAYTGEYMTQYSWAESTLADIG